MKPWLVFGLSGMLGRALAPRLPTQDREILAITRQTTPPAIEGVRWLRASLPTLAPDERVFDTILSLGPLDLFAEWLRMHEIEASRLVAIGSCSLHFKADSPDAGERELAVRLQCAEDSVFAVARQRGIAATILRPTLMYGNGLDRSLTPMLAFARRWRVLPLPTHAAGLRQPVHVDDVAGAVLACLLRPESVGRAYDLPGGERLAFDAMLRRAADAASPGIPVLTLPNGVFRMALALGLRLRGWHQSAAGIVRRLDQDQIADPADARRDLDFRPRDFHP